MKAIIEVVKKSIKLGKKLSRSLIRFFELPENTATFLMFLKIMNEFKKFFS